MRVVFYLLIKVFEVKIACISYVLYVPTWKAASEQVID